MSNIFLFIVFLIAIISIILSAIALNDVNNISTKTQNVSNATTNETTFQGAVIANSLGSREKLLIPVEQRLIWDVQTAQTARVIVSEFMELSILNLVDGFSATLTAEFTSINKDTTIGFHDSNLVFSADSALNTYSNVYQTSQIRVQMTNGLAIVEVIPIPTILGLQPTLWYSVRSPNYYTLESNGTIATLKPLGTQDFTLTHNGDDITLVPMGNGSTGMQMGPTSQLIVSSVPVNAIRTGARETTWVCVGQNIPQENNSLVFWNANDVSVQLYTNLDDPIRKGINFDLVDPSDPSGVGVSPPAWEQSLQVCVCTAGSDAWIRLFMNNGEEEEFDGSFTTLNGGPGDLIVGKTDSLPAPNGIIGDVIIFNRELTPSERSNVVHELGRLYGFSLLPFD